MPPRAVKKASGAASAAKKTTPRTAKASPKKPAAEPKVEEVSTSTVVEVKEETRIELIALSANPEEEPSVSESKPNVSSDAARDEEDQEEAHGEEDKGERLELEDNEPEYEPEDDTAVDYDENEMEDDGKEEGNEGEEDGEEGDEAEEEEGDVVDEGDVEGEEDDENVEEEHDIDVEEEEHHEVVKERRKRKEFEVFVGGLDKDVTEADLKKVFSEVGEVTEVRLMMNPLTKKNKGFAFLRFATVEQAKRAVSELKNPVVKGKQCGVTPSQDSDTLFVGNICKTWTKENLKDKLKTYGIENMEDLMLVEDTSKKGTNRGFAFLEFSSRSDAMDAFKRLQRRDVVFGVDRSAKVSFADSFIEPDDEIMAQVKTIFIDGLPAAWDEDRVREHVKKFGEIENIELARNMPAAKRKDYGFVTFSTHDAAVECAESINNAVLGEGNNKVTVRARLSRPLQKGRGKPARGGFRTGRGAIRGGRLSWGRPPLHRFPGRGPRGFGGRGASIRGRVSNRPITFRDRRPVMSISDRDRRLPPLDRFYNRRPPVPAYPKSGLKRDYRRDEPAPRSRAASDYEPRVAAVRRPSHRDEYPSRGTGYSDILPHSTSRNADRRSYPDDGYGRKFERPPRTYREGRSRVYDYIPGSKRPYSAMDYVKDDAPRYADANVRQSRARLDYGVGGGSTQSDDPYSERVGRSHTGYSGSRSSLSGQDTHELYSGRQGMGYNGGSISGGGDGIYSSSISSSYLSRGSDVGGSSYSSLYSGRNLSGSGYLGGSGSGSYY